MKDRFTEIAWFAAYAAATALLVISLAWGEQQTDKNVLAAATMVHPAKPEPSITLPCEVVAVHDGDTVTVEGTWRTNVRLLNVWAPELREPGGKKALDHVSKLVRSRKATLSIPLDGARSIGDVMTFGRVLGEIWMDDGCESVNTLMVRDGFATREKLQ